MKCLCALLVLVASAMAMNTGNRIVGGHPVFIQQHPYQVSLQHNRAHFCGGVLVKPNKVLTAAHCLNRFDNTVVDVYAGSAYHAQGGTAIATRSIVKHPEFNRQTTEGDIAVLTLVNSFQLGSTISTISLVGIGKKPQEGTLITATGWGRTQDMMPGPSPMLMAVQLSVVNNVACDRAYSHDPRPPHVTDRTFCAAYGRKQTFAGDSGGPAINSNKQLAGISIWGSSTIGYPSVFSDLSHAVIRRFVDDNL